MKKARSPNPSCFRLRTRSCALFHSSESDHRSPSSRLEPPREAEVAAEPPSTEYAPYFDPAAHMGASEDEATAQPRGNRSPSPQDAAEAQRMANPPPYNVNHPCGLCCGAVTRRFRCGPRSVSPLPLRVSAECDAECVVISRTEATRCRATTWRTPRWTRRSTDSPLGRTTRTPTRRTRVPATSRTESSTACARADSRTCFR